VYNKLLKPVTCSWLDFECHILCILLSIYTVLPLVSSSNAVQCPWGRYKQHMQSTAQHTSSSNVLSQCAFVFLQVTGSSSNGPLEIQQDFD